MTTAFASIDLKRVDKHGLQVMTRSGTNVHQALVWNFDFDQLEFVCDLFFGACNFLYPADFLK
jgi:hypothetical protein